MYSLCCVLTYICRLTPLMNSYGEGGVVGILDHMWCYIYNIETNPKPYTAGPRIVPYILQSKARQMTPLNPWKPAVLSNSKHCCWPDYSI